MQFISEEEAKVNRHKIFKLVSIIINYRLYLRPNITIEEFTKDYPFYYESNERLETAWRIANAMIKELKENE